MSSLTLGNGLMESTAFNNRLQSTAINLGTLATFGYGYGTTNNNGNMLSQTINAPGFSVTQNYSYDALSRLTGVSETSGWNQTYGYDRYGNRNHISSSSGYLPTYAPSNGIINIDANTNRIADSGFNYDLAGNHTCPN